MSPHPPQAFLFDVFGTVVDWRSGIIRAVAEAAAARGVALDAESFADRWRDLYQPSMEEVRSGRRAFVELDQLHRESLDRLLEDYGAASAFDGAARTALTRAWWRLDPWPDSVVGVAALRRRGFVAPCSNGGVALLAHMAKRAGLIWDAVLGAEPTRAYKPDPQAYLRSAALLGLAPERCMMVAAHNDDLAAADALGFMTAFVPRSREHGPKQQTDLAPSGPWTVVAETIPDIATQLSARFDGSSAEFLAAAIEGPAGG